MCLIKDVQKPYTSVPSKVRMEKYGEYRDSGTGIAPFLPIVLSASAKGGVTTKIFRYAKLVVKLIIALPVLLVYQFIPLQMFLNVLFKILIGFSTNVQVEGIKKTKIEVQRDYPQKNQIYYCNYTNPLDYWCLSQISRGNKFVVLVAHSKNQVIEFNDNSWWTFALFTLVTTGILPPRATGKGRGFQIVQLDKSLAQKYKDKIVYCFPEGTTSNGKSILPFELDCKNLENHVKFNTVNTISMRISPSHLVTPLPYEDMDSTKYWWKLLLFSSDGNGLGSGGSSGVECKYKISHKVNSSDVRIKLNNDDKYKLIGQSLKKDKKAKFIKVYKGPM